MQYEKIQSKTIEMLFKQFELHYQSFGWNMDTSIKKHYNWKRFRFMYYTTLSKPETKDVIEIIDNESDVKTKAVRFSYCSLNGNLFVRKMFIENESDKIIEYGKFMQEVKDKNYLNL